MPYNLAQAGVAVGRNRSTILKAIRRGVLSATRNETTGGWTIDPAELHRVFPLVVSETSGNTGGNRGNNGATTETDVVRELRARLADAQDQVADLRHRLDTATAQRDREAEERRQVQARLDALLTDQRQPARRSWWLWKGTKT